MSEKSALRLEEAMQSPPSDQTTPAQQSKARRRARLYKAACFYFAHTMANNLHKYAVAHSQEVDQTRWKEFIAPVNAHISPWIMLFSAPLPGSSKPSFLDTTPFFIAAIFSYFVYARFYYRWNQHNDKYQKSILIVAALSGLIPALSLSLGFMISVFCVAPKAALFGLLYSDILHLLIHGPWQKEDAKKQAVDVEKGLQSDGDAPEQSGIAKNPLKDDKEQIISSTPRLLDDAFKQIANEHNEQVSSADQIVPGEIMEREAYNYETTEQILAEQDRMLASLMTSRQPTVLPSGKVLDTLGVREPCVRCEEPCCWGLGETQSSDWQPAEMFHSTWSEPLIESDGCCPCGTESSDWEPAEMFHSTCGVSY